ncbi:MULTISPECIES: hypothetical protein [unclassified Escherichia]
MRWRSFFPDGCAELQQQFLEEFEAGLYGYTYLEDE